MIEVGCERCKVQLRLREELAGRRVRCPRCRKVFLVPPLADEPVPGVTVVPGGAGPTFCDGCGGTIAAVELRRTVGGKLLCSYCVTERSTRSPGEAILSEIDFDVPGAVVITDPDERERARREHDQAARQAHGLAEAQVDAFGDPVVGPRDGPGPPADGGSDRAIRVPETPAAATDDLDGATEEMPIGLGFDGPGPASGEGGATSGPADEDDFVAAASEALGIDAAAPRPPEEVPVPRAARVLRHEEPVSPPPPMEPPPRPVDGDLRAEEALAALLRGRGLVDEATLDKACELASRARRPLAWALASLEVLSESELAQALARELGHRACTEGPLVVVGAMRQRLAARSARSARVLPVRFQAERLVVALSNPCDEHARAVARAAAGGSDPIFIVATEEVLAAALAGLYGRLPA
ncbi:MAG: hypothetical protein HY722_08465 [Planctomycetes bacterium]|nr:hypothetical protein [Planctomycetota bacterium]